MECLSYLSLFFGVCEVRPLFHNNSEKLIWLFSDWHLYLCYTKQGRKTLLESWAKIKVVSSDCITVDIVFLMNTVLFLIPKKKKKCGLLLWPGLRVSIAVKETLWPWQLLYRKIFYCGWLRVSDLVHYHHGRSHGSVQTDMVPDKELRVGFYIVICRMQRGTVPHWVCLSTGLTAASLQWHTSNKCGHTS